LPSTALSREFCLLAGAPRWRDPAQPFSRGELPRGTFASARHRRSSLASGGGARQFALRATTLRISRDFTVRASARFALVRHENLAFSARPRRPPTSCALRLRKPDRTIGLLTPSVTPRRLDRALQRSLPACHPGVASRVARCVRPPSRHRRFRAMSIPLPGRLPLARLHALRPKQTIARSQLRSPALAPHPCRPNRIGPRRRRMDRRSRLPRAARRAFRLALPQGEDASTQLLQPTTATSTLRIARFPALSESGRSSFDDELRASAWPATAPYPASEPARSCGGLDQKAPSERRTLTRGLLGRGRSPALLLTLPVAPSRR
jgi:hypothetical protein